MRDGAVVTDADRVHWVGARADIGDLPPGSSHVELGDAMLMPGLVNAHIHLDLAPFAGLLHGRSFFAWIRGIVAGSAAVLDDDARADAARWSVIEQLEHGVTTLADTSPSTSGFDAIRACGARGIAYLEVFGPDPAQCDDAFGALRPRIERARVHETSLVQMGVSPHAPYSVSDALFGRVAEYARAEALPLAVHIAESEDESQLVESGQGEFAAMLFERGIAAAPRAASPIALLDRTRILRTQPLCIHAVRAGSDDVLRLADNGAGVAHCPRSNAWFGHGQAPVAAFRAHHVPVGLGTDSAASNDEFRLLGEARAATDDGLSPSDRIALATTGGAQALGIGNGLGTLSPGAPADLAAFAIDDTTEADRDPAAYLVEHRSNTAAALVVVAGTVRVRNGRALARDDATNDRVRVVRHRAEQWAAAAGWRAAREPF